MKIYTDGASSPNTDLCAGGWGVVFTRDGEETYHLSGGAVHTTNNIMEMTAVFEAMKVVLTFINHPKTPQHITIVSDSQYVLKGLTEWHEGWARRGWKTANGDPVKNKDLWIDMLKVKCCIELAGKTLDFEWVKGHNGDEFNEIADQLAVKAKEEIANAKIR